MTDINDFDPGDDLDLTCPGCGADLLVDDTYNLWRVCGQCNRHFWISARERAQLFSRFGAFFELEYVEPVIDAIDHHERLTAQDRQDDVRDRTALADAVVTGRATFAGLDAVVVILDPALLPTGLGIITADKVIAAARQAMSNRLPLVIICGGGSLPASAGLLGAAQSLRISGVIGELHRAALPLVAVLTHPTGGNLLPAIVTNADVRLVEPGTEYPDVLPIDLHVTRQTLDQTIADVLTLFTSGGRTPLTLGSSSRGASARLRSIKDQTVLDLSVDSEAWDGQTHWRLIRRAQMIASNQELPIVFTITGEAPLELPVQTELRDLLLRHRRPVIGIIAGVATSAHLNLLAVDTLIASNDLAIPGPGTKHYSGSEAKSSGIVDNVMGDDEQEIVGSALESWGRLSPSRRFELRLRLVDRRGAEVPGSHEAARLELLDLKDLQAGFRRSVDDWRHKFEQREFSMPNLATLQARTNFRPPTLPKLSKPDLVEIRDKWLARRRTPAETKE